MSQLANEGAGDGGELRVGEEADGLDAGEATVDVTLNGEKLGTRMWNPFRFELAGKLRSGKNELVVTIPTNWGNFYPRGYAGRRVTLTPIGLMVPPELV